VRTISPYEIEEVLETDGGLPGPSMRSLLLPAPPAGMPLATLGLSTRCFNALVAAGIARTPALLGEMTIDEFLTLPAVGVVTLRDYLSQSRHWIGRAGGSMSREAIATAAARLLKVASRARVGPKLLASPMPAPPAATPLSELQLDARSFNALCRAGYTADISRLGDLSVRQAMKLRGFGIACVRVYLAALVRWADTERKTEGGGPEIDTLDRIIAAVGSGRRHAIGGLHLPDPPEGMSVEALPLTARSYNCLQSAGIDGRGRRLSQMRVDQLLALPAFGVTSLMDVSRCLREAYLRSPPSRSQSTASLVDPHSEQAMVRAVVDPDSTARLASLAAELTAAIGSSEIGLFDPRFTDLLREGGAKTVADFAEALKVPGPAVARRERVARAMLDRIQRCLLLSLEEEAIDVASIQKGSRGERMLRARLGFGDLVPNTLQAVGLEHGVTRERVRQVCHPRHLIRIGRRGYLPILRGVLRRIIEAMPARCESIERQLVDRGLVERGTEVGEILGYAASLGIQCDAVESCPGDARIVATRADAEAIEELRSRMRRAVHLDGAFMLSRLVDSISRAEGQRPWDQVAEVLLDSDTTLRVLTGEPRWVSAANVSDTAFVQRIGEVLRVSGPILVGDLRRALRREYRRGGLVPTTTVLSEVVTLTERLGFDESGRVVWNPAIPLPPLRGDSAIVVKVLEDLGGIAERRVWQRKCREAGVSDSSFGRQSSYSPLVRKLDRGIFGVVGRQPKPGEVEAIQAASEWVAGGLLDRGWTTAGEYWISQVLSTSTFETGVLTIPAAARSILRDSYQLIDEDLDSACNLVVGAHSMWGCRKLLVLLGAEPGDTIVMRFNNVDATARMDLGDQAISDLLNAGG